MGKIKAFTPIWGPLLLLLMIASQILYFWPAENPEPFIEDQLNYAEIAREAQNMGELDEAIAVWQTLLEEQGPQAEAYFNLGMIYSLSQPEDAESFFNAAVELDENYRSPADTIIGALQRGSYYQDEPAYGSILLGQAYASLDEWGLARWAFERSTQQDPNYAEAWAYLGESYAHLELDPLPPLEEALRLNPTSYAANAFMGYHYRRQGQPELALVYFQTASTIENYHIDLEIEIGNTLAQMGSMEDALFHFAQAIQIEPNQFLSWMAMAQFSIDYELRVEEIGLTAARQAVVIEPENPAGLTLLGRAYSVLGDDFYAERFLTEALSYDQSYAPAHYYLGIEYIHQQELGLAEFHLVQAGLLGEGTAIEGMTEEVLERYFGGE